MSRGSGWNDTTPRFQNVPKHHVDRPNPMNTEPEFCWCGEQHNQSSENPAYWSAGSHPWPPLDDPEGIASE